ncbi:hypothetical protein KEM56_003509 [Ascosphaera pollenicola]|nr:hypothetical protein KEM56_003509 [Ascosphaera pollenicola]
MENNPIAPLSQGPTLDEKPSYAEKLKQPAPSKKPTEAEIQKSQRPSEKPASPSSRASEKRRTTRKNNQKIQWAPLNIGLEKRAQTAM